MALRYSTSTLLPISITQPKHSCPFLSNSLSRAFMLSQSQTNHLRVRRPIKSSFNDKVNVFEDPSGGIVCYRDINGEMICEGYDEGPRMNHQQLTTMNSNTWFRDIKIIDMLRRSWLQQEVVEDINPVDPTAHNAAPTR